MCLCTTIDVTCSHCAMSCRYWQGWLGFSAAATVHPPSQVLHVDREILDFGVCLPATINRRLLVLHNTANVPLEFAWDLAVFEEERKVISGCLTVTPSTGKQTFLHDVITLVSCQINICLLYQCPSCSHYAREQSCHLPVAGDECCSTVVACKHCSYRMLVWQQR